jgi:hypothetical protein
MLMEAKGLPIAEVLLEAAAAPTEELPKGENERRGEEPDALAILGDPRVEVGP